MIKTKWIENQLRNWIVNVFEEDEKKYPQHMYPIMKV